MRKPCPSTSVRYSSGVSCLRDSTLTDLSGDRPYSLRSILSDLIIHLRANTTVSGGCAPSKKAV